MISRPLETCPARRPPLRLVAFAAAFVLAGAQPLVARAADVPLPPPPPGTRRVEIPLPPPPSGTSALPRPPGAPEEQCSGCHAKLLQAAVVHGALTKPGCTSCHRPVVNEAGKCRSHAASKWSLVRSEPELCYGCHQRKDQTKVVHTAIRQGSCLSCHTPHSSAYKGLLSSPSEKICFDCHDSDSLITKPVKHAPVAEGRCVECHSPHGGSLPNNLRGESGSAFCLRCHDAKAPAGKGTPGAAFRIDLGKSVVHGAFKRVDCLGCHDGGHGSDNLKLLKKPAVELCYGCHARKDGAKYPHSAVVVGDCAVCHDPHSSDNAKLVAKPTSQQTCFICHQDDLTGRKVIHAPVRKGCDECHDPHGAPNRNALKGEGKALCYRCHKPIDGGKVKHAALDRYGCTRCHDPHGAARPAMLAKSVNELCIGCHPDQRDGRHITAITGKSHPVGGDLNDPRREGRDFSCASCHNPHGSDSQKLFYTGATPMEMCAGCHGDKSGLHPEAKDVISQAKRKPRPGAATGSAGGGSGGGGGSGSGSGSGADDRSGGESDR